MIEKKFDTPRPVRLDVRVMSATIEVTAVDGDVSSVSVSGTPRMLEATKVELVGDRLLVEMQRKLFGRFGPQLRGEDLQVQISVPTNSRAELSFAAGDATLSGAFEQLHVQSASGSLRANGEISDDADVKTVSGHIRLGDVGGDLTAASVSGNVIADAVGGSVTMKSVSGNVHVGSVRQGRVKVQSVSGNVEVGIAPGTNLEVDASTASGVLSSEVALSGVPTSKQGPTVVVRGQTVSGDVRLFRAA